MVGRNGSVAVIGVDGGGRDGASLEPSDTLDVDDLADNGGVLGIDGLVLGRNLGGEEVNHTFTGAGGQGVGGDGHILGLL